MKLSELLPGQRYLANRLILVIVEDRKTKDANLKSTTAEVMSTDVKKVIAFVQKVKSWWEQNSWSEATRYNVKSMGMRADAKLRPDSYDLDDERQPIDEGELEKLLTYQIIVAEEFVQQGIQEQLDLV